MKFWHWLRRFNDRSAPGGIALMFAVATDSRANGYFLGVAVLVALAAIGARFDSDAGPH